MPDHSDGDHDGLLAWLLSPVAYVIDTFRLARHARMTEQWELAEAKFEMEEDARAFEEDAYYWGNDNSYLSDEDRAERAKQLNFGALWGLKTERGRVELSVDELPDYALTPEQAAERAGQLSFERLWASKDKAKSFDTPETPSPDVER